jgi:hypothetical protein
MAHISKSQGHGKPDVKKQITLLIKNIYLYTLPKTLQSVLSLRTLIRVFSEKCYYSLYS